MLALLISAGILSFGWGALYRVSRHNCCDLAARAPYVPAARGRDGGEVVRAEPVQWDDQTQFYPTEPFSFIVCFFSPRFPKRARVLHCQHCLTLWAARALFKTNSFQPNDVCTVWAMREGRKKKIATKTIRRRDAKANLKPLYQLPLSQWETETLTAALITEVLFEKLPIWQMSMLSEI